LPRLSRISRALMSEMMTMSEESVFVVSTLQPSAMYANDAQAGFATGCSDVRTPYKASSTWAIDDQTSVISSARSS